MLVLCKFSGLFLPISGVRETDSVNAPHALFKFHTLHAAEEDLGAQLRRVNQRLSDTPCSHSKGTRSKPVNCSNLETRGLQWLSVLHNSRGTAQEKSKCYLMQYDNRQFQVLVP